MKKNSVQTNKDTDKLISEVKAKREAFKKRNDPYTVNVVFPPETGIETIVTEVKVLKIGDIDNGGFTK